jgi:hypothetical protein
VAIWQFTIALLPRQWLDAGGTVDSLYGKGSYSTSAAWETATPESIQRHIGSILPLVKSWSGSQWSELAWGDPEADDTENGIQLLAENGRVRSLGARFDMRRPNLRLFGHVVSVAKDLRLALLDVERKRMVPADVNALLWAAATSRAAHFLKDRSSFLTSVERENGRAT